MCDPIVPAPPVTTRTAFATSVEAAERGMRFGAPAAEADEDRIDEPGLGSALGVSEQLDADIELLERLFEPAHVPAGHRGNEARVAARPQILGAGAGGRLASALQRRVEAAGNGGRERDRLGLTDLYACEAWAVVEGARELPLVFAQALDFSRDDQIFVVAEIDAVFGGELLCA